MVRRRADRLARMTLRVAFDVLGDRKGLPMVYVSRHGAVRRSVNLLEELAGGSLLSPAGFAASVHNASTGLLGIVRADPAPCTAIAADDAGVVAMLSEVSAYLADGYDEVLAVLCDEPPPTCYAQYLTAPEWPAAWAGRFRADDAAGGLRLVPVAGARRCNDEAAVLAWVRWLIGDAQQFDAADAWQVQRA